MAMKVRVPSEGFNTHSTDRIRLKSVSNLHVNVKIADESLRALYIIALNSLKIFLKYQIDQILC